MKNTSKTWNSPLALIILAVASFAAGTSHAQEAAGTDAPITAGQPAVTLDPYVIHEQRVVDWNSQTTFSGSRTAQNLLDIPVNISILTKDYLKDIGAIDMLGILPYAASGVSQRVTYREDLTVRGFRQSMLVDGLASDHTFNMLPLYNVQTVEIVKGPTALVFNNFGNVSGTVNYVTKRPSVTPDNSGDMQITVGNYGTYIGEATVYGPLSKDGSVRYRFTLGAQQQSGWFGRSLKDDTNYSNNNEVSGSVDWNVNRKLTIQTDVSYIFTQMRDNSEALIDPATGRVWRAEVNGYNTTAPWTFQREQLYHGRIAAIFQANSEVSVRALFNTTRQYSNYNLEDAELNTTVNGVVVPNGLQIAESPNYKVVRGMAAQTFFYYPGVDDTIVDLTWSHSFNQWVSNRLNAGYDYNNSQNNYIDYITPLADIVIGAPVASRAPAPVLLPANIVSYAPHVGEGGWSGYVEDSLSFFNNKLSVNGGGRYVSGSMDTINHQLFVPNLGVLYHVLPVMSLYASTANSFTPKTGYDVFGHQFTDQIGKSKEVGLKFNAFNEHLFGTIDYFDIVYSPVTKQVQGINPLTGFLIYGNAQVGQQTNKGVEADLGYVVNFWKDEWSSYLTYYSATPLDQNGNTPSSAIKKKYTFLTKYRFGSGPLRWFHIGAGASHYGGSPGTGFPWMPAYTLYDAFAGYKKDKSHWSIAASANNLLNKKDYLVGSEATFAAYLGAPLMVRVAIGYTW